MKEKGRYRFEDITRFRKRDIFNIVGFYSFQTDGIVPVSPEITLEYLQKAIEVGGKVSS